MRRVVWRTWREGGCEAYDEKHGDDVVENGAAYTETI